MGSPALSVFTRRGARGMTLIEIVLALSILALSLGGILAALLQSRRLTEGSVIQNSAMTVVQGYIEQIKNMELKDVVNAPKDPAAGGIPVLGASFKIPTRFKEPPTSGTDDGEDALWTSAGSPPDLSTLTPGITPSGVTDNLKDFPDVSGPTSTALAWASVWPGALNYPTVDPVYHKTSTPYATDLHLNIWVWVQDLTGTTANATQVYGLTLIYTWQYQDGNKTRYIMGTVRSIRSAVPTF